MAFLEMCYFGIIFVSPIFLNMWKQHSYSVSRIKCRSCQLLFMTMNKNESPIFLYLTNVSSLSFLYFFISLIFINSFCDSIAEFRKAVHLISQNLHRKPMVFVNVIRRITIMCQFCIKGVVFRKLTSHHF